MKKFLRPFSSLSLIQEGLRKYVHEVLVNRRVLPSMAPEDGHPASEEHLIENNFPKYKVLFSVPHQ